MVVAMNTEVMHSKRSSIKNELNKKYIHILLHFWHKYFYPYLVAKTFHLIISTVYVMIMAASPIMEIFSHEA